LLDTLNSYRADVLHFSGHGGGQTLLFDNEKAGNDGGTVLDFDMVARVVGATSAAPKLLVLVACDTVDGVDRFLDMVPAVIAMADTIDDEAACEFSKRFYQSLSAGATIGNSFEQAKLVLENKGYADASLPTLVARDGQAAQRALL
jgi:CHAT domain-containing protein